MTTNITNIGIMMSCFDEVEAVSFAIKELRKFYPENKIYIFNESSKDYSFLLKDNNIKIKNDKDTMSFYYQNNISDVYLLPEFQLKIQDAFLTFLSRVHQTIEYSQSEYLLLMDPDVLIRGQLNIPSNINLLGSLRNRGAPLATKKILQEIEGAIIVDEWGATPGIFKVETFLKAYNKFISIPNLLQKFTQSWYAFYAHDIIIPMLFALIGEKEQLNADFTECNSDIDWQTNNKKLVHHYKKYYSDVEIKFPFFKEVQNFMNVFIINNSSQNCGVYQYGKRFGSIASKSKKYNFMYYELNSEEEFIELYEIHKPKAIIYNYLAGTMPWLNGGIIQTCRDQGVKQYTIVHNSHYDGFDYYLHQNPYHPHVDDRNFSLARPLFDYQSSKIERGDDTLHIGTFGFGFKCKYIDQICKTVNEQITDRKVQINLHLTESHYSPNWDTIETIKQDCFNQITHDNIKLNITHDFLTDEEMLNFLSKNDLNIFFYEKYPDNYYNGISSTIDYALSVKKPVAICESNMFSHIWNVQPSICVENNSLLSIIENGFAPLEEKYNLWTNEKFIDILEQIIEKTTEVIMTQFNSDAKQDQFVANILNFKKNGYCVDIGSHHSITSNNSYYFQDDDWTSISVELDGLYNGSYSSRKNGVHLNENALGIDYKKQFEEYEFPKTIDYLSLDVDTLSLDVLKLLPLDEYRFKVITIEHDGYLYGDRYREPQRGILNSHGYLLLCSNVYVEQPGYEGKEFPFEDWWIDPSEFDNDLIERIKCDSTLPSVIISKF